MAQLNNQWQELAVVYAGNTGYGDIYLTLMGILVSQDITNNKSRVGLGLRIYTGSGNWETDINDTLDGQYQDLGYRYFSPGYEYIHIIEKDIYHNSDGTGSGSFSGSMWTSYFGTTSGSASFTLPTIPRYASITSFSVSKRDETSVTFNWKANATIDYVWYSTNDGSSWTGYNTPDGTSGSFTVSGLSANTTYNFKLRVRRKDSQLNTTSSRVQQTTYNYPYVQSTSSDNLVIGTQQTLTLYNPLGRTFDIYMKKDNTSGTEFYSETTSGTSITFTPDSEIMYNSIPDAKEGNCVYYCVYSNHTSTAKNGKFSINENECIPEFNDFEYSTDLSNLTGDNATIIKGETTTTITINTSNKAIAKNGATIEKYRIECGDLEPVIIYEDSGEITGTIVGCNDAIIKVVPIDSRGVENNNVSKTLNFEEYIKPSFNTIKVERVDGVDAETHLDLTVNYWNDSFSKINIIEMPNGTYQNNGIEAIVNDGIISVTGTCVNSNSFVRIPLTNITINGKYTMEFNAINNGDAFITGQYARLETPSMTQLLTPTSYSDGSVTGNVNGTIGYLDIRTPVNTTCNYVINPKLYKRTDNEITKIQYQIKQSSSSTWSDWYPTNSSIDVSHLTYSGNTATLEDELLHENGSSGGFTTGTQFDIRIKISDGHSTTILSSVESSVQTLTDGSVGMSMNKDQNGNYHFGIDGMPDDNYSLNTKKINASGGFYENGVKIGGGITLDDVYPVGSIYLTVGNESPASLFGGSWTKMTGGYLYGCVSSINNSSYTGTGTQSHAITINQMPSHTHTAGKYDSLGISHASIASGNNWTGLVASGSSATTHITTNSRGSGEGHSHNVAYIGVWVWKRTA